MSSIESEVWKPLKEFLIENGYGWRSLRPIELPIKSYGYGHIPRENWYEVVYPLFQKGLKAGEWITWDLDKLVLKNRNNEIVLVWFDPEDKKVGPIIGAAHFLDDTDDSWISLCDPKCFEILLEKVESI